LSSASATRIGPVDGLRTIAVVGVVYAHVWSFVLDTPPFRVGPVDVNRVLGLFGTGVDLFFVISGFCMYLMHGRQRVGPGGTRTFIGNRFRRIAPAFYAAVVVSAVFAAVARGRFPVLDLLAHLTFLFSLLPGMGKLAPPFWSLATEWHFYMLLPALLFLARRFGLRAAVGAAMAASIAFRIAIALAGLETPWGINVDHLIFSRFIEFGWGILAAELYLSRTLPPPALRGTSGFLLGWLVSLVGRFMMTEGAGRLRYVGPFVAAASIAVLSLGYMLVVWSVVSGPSVAARFCAWTPMRQLGRISYGMYLWHWDLGMPVARRLARTFGVGPLTPVLYTCATLLVLIPISEISYRLLEAPYFKRRAQTSNLATSAASP
jgi:peptidoglycan/LPS O-acetylase OafA/YrhL